MKISMKLFFQYVAILFNFSSTSSHNKPTRITAYSSTLIDNIFTNDLDYKHKSGIVITDISDHLPIITSCNSIKRLCTSSLRSYKRNMLSKDKLLRG